MVSEDLGKGLNPLVPTLLAGDETSWTKYVIVKRTQNYDNVFAVRFICVRTGMLGL